jgi:pSer/pThr/pTyr-binding forkhead associated (FHA) protein
MVLRLAEELHLRPEETDSLLRAADYALEYGNDTRGVGHSEKQRADQPSGRSVATTLFGYLHLNDKFHNEWFELRGENLVIGRQPDCDLVIAVDYDLVSRVHARIYRVQSDVYLEDMNSANGTYIEGKQITGARKLRAGHHILLGDASPIPGVCVLEFTGKSFSTRRTKATSDSHGTRN